MTFRFPSNNTLAKIAIYGGIATISLGMYTRFSVEAKIKKQDYFRQAIKTLRSHQGAVSLLGEPIKELGIKSFGNPEINYCDKDKAKFVINVKGPNDKGVLYLWAQSEENIWKLQHMELELKSKPNQRLVILKRTKNEDLS